MRFKYYLRLWVLMSKNSFASVVTQKGSLFIFLFGKLLRFGVFFLFLYFLLNGTETLAGYSRKETLFFFLTFNVIDVFSQFFFREVYRFRPQVVSGQFDLTLTKPSSALFRSLMGGADPIDLLTIPLLIVAVVHIGLGLGPSYLSAFLYLVLVVNGLIIATAFHIAVLAFGIITLEVDHTIMIYRDLINLGRFPTEIYKEPVRGVITYIIPVSIMIALPAKVLFGVAGTGQAIFGIAFGAVALYASTIFWKFALSRYTSASS